MISEAFFNCKVKPKGFSYQANNIFPSLVISIFTLISMAGVQIQRIIAPQLRQETTRYVNPTKQFIPLIFMLTE